MFNIRKVAILGHVYRRMSPVPGVVCSVVAVQAVISRVLKILRGFFRFFHIPADFGVFLPGKCTLTEALCFGYDTVAERHREIVAAGFFDRLYYLNRETVSVFKASAVLIGTFIHITQSKLIEKISLMNRMNLNTVYPRIHQHSRAFCKGIDKLLNLRNGHFPGRDLVRPAVRRRTCGGGNLVEIHKWFAQNTESLVCVQFFHHRAYCKRSSETCGQLYEKLCAGLVKFRHPFFEILVHFLVFVKPLSEHGIIHRLTSGHHKPGIVFGDLKNKPCAVPVKMVLFHPAEKVRPPHTRQHNTVFDLAFAYFPRGKKRLKSLLHRSYPP